MDLSPFAALVPHDHGLCVFSTLRAEGGIQSSVVNAGVLDDPATGEPVVGLVAAGPVKLRNVRRDRRVSIVVRANWEWAAVEGSASLIGPDDPHAGIDAERLRRLLREIFTAAGGTHDDWDAYDRTMAEERRTAVLIRPERIYSNPS